ncbi:MAG TPA: tetratricopeptide repeat protein [Geminicoccaceae bacterium]|nr:tetratricopeptide repeat protein [Geminicoccus sp.]HMU49223.1 tetratricopeptide repeat protein [Geminicoccaceae bacterium]
MSIAAPLVGLVLGLWLAMTTVAAADDLADAQDRGLELFRAGRYSEAVPHFEKALDLAEARFGPEDPAVAYDLNNLAEAQRLLERYDRAEQLYLRAIIIDEKGGAQGHGLATSLNNLALVYKAEGRTADAERLYLRSLSIFERTLGPNHPDVARSLNNLASLYRGAGQPAKARPLQERAVAIAERSLGPKSATTQALRRNLAALEPATAAPPPPAGKAAASSRPPAGKAAASSRPTAARAPSGPPAPKPARQASAAAAPTTPAAAAQGGYAIHLESIRDGDKVEAEWQGLVRKHPSLAGLGLRPALPVEVPGKGTYYRVAAGSFASREEAARACAPIKAAGAYCAILTP